MSKESKKACEIIEGLISAINVMPLFWEEFVGDKLAKKAKNFLKENGSDYWVCQEIEED